MWHCIACHDLVVARKPAPPLCADCKRRGRLVSLQKALGQGFPLATLRAVGAAYVGGGTPYFSAARLSPQLLDPAAARRDVARLRRDRRDARPEHDAARVALLCDASLRPWSEGAHVAAVERGLLSPQQV